MQGYAISAPQRAVEGRTIFQHDRRSLHPKEESRSFLRLTFWRSSRASSICTSQLLLALTLPFFHTPSSALRSLGNHREVQYGSGIQLAALKIVPHEHQQTQQPNQCSHLELLTVTNSRRNLPIHVATTGSPQHGL